MQFSSIFQDESGKTSMKRLCGFICTVTLCVVMYRECFAPAARPPSEILVNAVTALAFGCLGLASADKIFGSKKIANGESEGTNT